MAVASSWVTLHTGFVIAYLSTYLEGGGLDFPGDDESGLTDFAYFAMAVGSPWPSQL